MIFASQQDPGAGLLAERWARYDAAVLTPRDLSREGWRHDLRSPEDGVAVVSGRRIPVGQIEGVLIRWPAVFEHELLHIVPEERSYVASEMTAFLRSWVTRLPCPIINRPTAGSLLGPSWRREQWIHAAVRMSIPVYPVRRLVTAAGETPQATELSGTVTVTVVGERCFGNVDPVLYSHARRLAAAGGVTLVSVQFSSPAADAVLQSADLLPDLDDEAIVRALLECLLHREEHPPRHESP